MQPQLLLELQRAHAGDRLEVVVQCRDGHAAFLGQFLDAQAAREVLPQPGDCLGRPVALAVQPDDLPQTFTCGTHQQSIQDLPPNPPASIGISLGRSSRPTSPQHRIEKIHGHRRRDDTGVRLHRLTVMPIHVEHQLPRHVEIEEQLEGSVGSFPARLFDIDDGRQTDRGQQEGSFVVAKSGLAESDMLRASTDHAKAGLEKISGRTVPGCQAGKGQAGDSAGSAATSACMPADQCFQLPRASADLFIFRLQQVREITHANFLPGSDAAATRAGAPEYQAKTRQDRAHPSAALVPTFCGKRARRQMT